MATGLDWKIAVEELKPAFVARTAGCDDQDRFVSDNIEDLKARKMYSAMIPTALGGGGVPHSEMCALIRDIARSCSSTALAFSMHQHLVAAAAWNYLHGNPGEKLLRAVVDGEKVLVSTGANDWLASSGAMQACDGGFRCSARKGFASGCPSGDILVTSGRYQDPEQGWQVLHFSLPMSAEGVRIDPSWEAMGMRGTGSNTVILEDVFVPEAAVSLRRPAGQFHNVWNIVITVALPLIASVYVGVAEASASIARTQAVTSPSRDVTAALVGEMENELTTAQLALDSMVTIANDLQFEPNIETTSRVLIRKTIATQAAIRTAGKALEVTGGRAYLRDFGLERLLRDSYAGQFHPLPPHKQYRFSGCVALGWDGASEPPVAGLT